MAMCNLGRIEAHCRDATASAGPGPVCRRDGGGGVRVLVATGDGSVLRCGILRLSRYDTVPW